MPKKLILLALSCLFLRPVGAHNDSSLHVVTPHVSPSLKFTENLGQWKNNILFRAQLDGGCLFLEKNSLTFNFYDKVKYRSLHHGGLLKGEYKDLEIKNHAYRIHFEGCNTNASTIKEQQGADYENYFLGNDKSNWRSNVRNYHQVWLKELYPNIDYEVFTATQGIKYNFHVKPGANVAQIKMRYEGVNHLKLKNGALIIALQINGVTEQKPYAFQIINGKTVKVACNYKLKDNTVSFEFPQGYNKAYELVIDPVLVFAAQSGSNADNFGMTATFDTQGNLYAGGTAYDNGYPTTFGAFNSTFTGAGGTGLTDVVITKYNSTGNALLYSTYIGGFQTEVVSSLIVDYNNNMCFYGTTGSNNFPMVSGAYDNTFNGGVPLSFYMNGT
ncbi:MAG: hypothetical protein IT236_07845, partial [Bacteroidia bacterium]|nr:hypothetical protein [Bacteroidia bacterium]